MTSPVELMFSVSVHSCAWGISYDNWTVKGIENNVIIEMK